MATTASHEVQLDGLVRASLDTFCLPYVRCDIISINAALSHADVVHHYESPPLVAVPCCKPLHAYLQRITLFHSLSLSLVLRIDLIYHW
jgi:hypothetical protein